MLVWLFLRKWDEGWELQGWVESSNLSNQVPGLLKTCWWWVSSPQAAWSDILVDSNVFGRGQGFDVYPSQKVFWPEASENKPFIQENDANTQNDSEQQGQPKTELFLTRVPSQLFVVHAFERQAPASLLWKMALGLEKLDKVVRFPKTFQ